MLSVFLLSTTFLILAINSYLSGTSSSKYLEGLKSTYQQHKKSLPLCVTVPFYSNKEYLSALAYYTHHHIFAPNLQLQDLLGELICYFNGRCGVFCSILRSYDCNVLPYKFHTRNINQPPSSH